MLSVAAPIPASSGRTGWHRLHRGGDRNANSALWRIALVRMHCHQPTKDYVARRTAQGKTKTEIMRCLKRYVAREVFPHLLAAAPGAAPPLGHHWHVGVQAYLYRAGTRAAGFDDPSGGHFDAAGDFDRLIPDSDAGYPLLSLVDPYGRLELSRQSMPGLIAEIDRLFPQARQGAEQHGLRRLRTLAQACASSPGAVLVLEGD